MIRRSFAGKPDLLRALLAPLRPHPSKKGDPRDTPRAPRQRLHFLAGALDGGVRREITHQRQYATSCGDSCWKPYEHGA
jgi:hypothetical protein